MYAEFIIEGEKIVHEALHLSYPVKLLCATSEWLSKNSHSIPHSIPVEDITEQQLQQISSLENPQPVLAIAEWHQKNIEDAKFTDEWIVAADSINDPGNFGTIIRTADWFGIKNIICTENCVDATNSKVMQAGMGSVLRVNIFYCDLLNVLKKLPFKKYAATLHGSYMSKKINYEKGILIIGNESHGVDEKILALCDEQITIQKYGEAESLNAAVACAIILSQFVSK